MANTTTMDAAPNIRQEQVQSSSTKEEENQDARFSCNICFDSVTEPVVTQCGHLYCWPCLYRWLAPGMTNQERATLGMQRMLTPLDQGRRVCPVCKSGCSVPTVVPIYVRNNGDKETPIGARATTPETREEPPATIQPSHSGGSVSDLNSFENMGLDIDGDDLEVHDEHSHSNTEIPTSVTTTGLRQRRRTESRDEANAELVPTRPTPSRDRASTDVSNPGAMVRNHSPGPTPNHYASATLSYGLVLAMHQTLLNATGDAATNNNNNNGTHNATETESIPSLHYPTQRRDSSMADDTNEWDQDPASTVFLSRLLLGLSLFVLFCLLSF